MHAGIDRQMKTLTVFTGLEIAGSEGRKLCCAVRLRDFHASAGF